MSLPSRGMTATAHFEVPHCSISRTASSTARVEATIAVLRRVGELAAEVGGVTVVGSDQSDLELDVRESHDADPERRDEELGIGPLVVHVLDAVLGLVVLHADPRLLRTHPVGGSAGERRVGAGVAEEAPVELRADADLMSVGSASDHLPCRHSMGRQLGEPRTKARIDVPLQNFRGGVHVRIGVERAPTVSHDCATQRIEDTSPNSRHSLRQESPPSSLR